VNLFEGNGYERLTRALRVREEQSKALREYIEAKEVKELLKAESPPLKTSDDDLSDYQVNFESDLWNCFIAAGEGYAIFLYQASYEKVIWCYPTRQGQPHIYYEVKVMDVLLENGLYETKGNDLPVDAELRYKYTDKGRQFYDEIKDMPTLESQQTFRSRIEIDWSKV
jgi:hypothetical protein